MQVSVRHVCSQCHIRKVKCDAQEVGFPCTNCRNNSRDDCRVHLKRKRGSARPPPPGPVPFRDKSVVAVSPPVPPRQQSASPGTTTPVPKVEVSNIVGVDINAAANGAYIFRRHLVEFIDQPRLTERPIDKDARMTYVGTDVSNINFLVQQQFGHRISNICHFPTNRIARQHTCYEPHRLPVEAFELPARAVVDKLLTAYFTHVNPGFPVVDEALFMKQYELRDPNNPPSLLLLHAILVVGAHVCFNKDEREPLKALFFRRAKSLFDARFERNRDTIVQAALLLTWHTDGPEDVAANAWFWTGVAVRTAMGMGMHRDAESSTLVPHNKRMWRRVWWLLFQCDTLVSLQYGRPQSIHLEESDVQKLKPSDFQDCGPNVRIEYVTQVTELSIIISKALRGRFSLAATPESRQEILHQTDEALANWSLRLPTPLQLHMGSSIDLWAANLQLIYNTALILLHRAKPYPPPTVRERSEDADICITAAGVVQTLFQCLCESDDIKHLWISSVNSLFTALIQLSGEIRLPNPVLVISALRRYDSAFSSLRELAGYWPNAQSILHFFESSARLQDAGTREAEPEIPANPAERDTCQIPGQSAGDRLTTQMALGDGEGATSQVVNPLVETSESAPLPDTSKTRDRDGKETLQSIENPVTTQALADPGLDTRDYAQEGFETWQDWLQTYWQQPEFADEFLFTF